MEGILQKLYVNIIYWSSSTSCAPIQVMGGSHTWVFTQELLQCKFSIAHQKVR